MAQAAHPPGVMASGFKAMTTLEDPLFREICELIGSHRSDPVELRPSTELSGDLNIDSVAAMDLIMEIEDKFDIDIPINMLSDLRNLGDLVALVRQHIEGG
jgi:acyl carrier protein